MKTKVNVTRTSVNISIPIDILKCAIENRPDFPEVKIKNKRKFAQEFANRLLEVDTDESGLGLFYRILDEVFEEMVEEDLNCLKILEEDYD